MRTRVFCAVAVAALTFQVGHASAANPYNMDDRCMPSYDEYGAAQDAPKAFVVGSNGRCGFWHGAKSPAQAKARAIQQCESYAGTSCRMVEHVDQ